MSAVATLPKLQDALEALVNQIQAALVNIPGRGQVYVGWPTGTEETQKLGQPDIEGSVTVWPLGGHDATRYLPDYEILAAPVVNLTATVSNNTVTFSGASDKAYNIHAFIGGRWVDAYYATGANESLANVAVGVAAAINALAISGVTATASGDGVSLAGAQFGSVNVGGSGTIVSEQRRTRQMVQVSIWVNDFPTRFQMADAIMTAIGTASNHFLTLTDGSQAYIEYQSDHMDDSSTSSYTVAVHHIVYMVEFGILQSATAYQIESIGTTEQINSLTNTTDYYGDTTTTNL